MKEGYTWITCSKVIQSEVKTLQTELSHLCGQNLLGIYLHGSLALGGFQPRRSDINVIVVTGQRMDLETKRACMTMLLRVSPMPCPIGIRFLVSSALCPFQHPLPCDFQYDETWRETAHQDLHDGSWKDWHERTRHDPDLHHRPHRPASCWEMSVWKANRGDVSTRVGAPFSGSHRSNHADRQGSSDAGSCLFCLKRLPDLRLSARGFDPLEGRWRHVGTGPSARSVSSPF